MSSKEASVSSESTFTPPGLTIGVISSKGIISSSQCTHLDPSPFPFSTVKFPSKP
eukprot:Awhi_evm1s14844